MSLIDDLKAKAEELLGGNPVEDITSQAGKLGDQAQNLKDSILPGDESGSEGEK